MFCNTFTGHNHISTSVTYEQKNKHSLSGISNYRLNKKRNIKPLSKIKDTPPDKRGREQNECELR